MTDVERRFTKHTVELRAAADKPRTIGGYAAKFEKESRNLGGFVEVIRSTFFNKSRGDGWPDVMARYNHDDNMLLGTTDSGTLRLSIDDVGLVYDVDPPQSRSDILELVGRGDVRKSSFAFRAMEDTWSVNDQGTPLRSLHTGQLIDVAPVNSPAYTDTTSSLRSLAEHMHTSLDEVRKYAEEGELKRFFIRTDKQGKPVVATKTEFGPAARMALLARKPH